MIRKANLSDSPVIAELAIKMWSNHSAGELAADFLSVISKNDSEVFLYKVNESVVGFAQCGLRYDYVEGTHTSPVGYLEGIFVEESFRHKGYAKELLFACEKWAKENGCNEFASDCEFSNTDSLQFHLKCGFDEANRIVCFTKKL